MTDPETSKPTRDGVSPGIPMRPCPRCSYPAAFDAFGNTDHVCADSPAWEFVDAIMPRHKGDRTIVIETTAAGDGNHMWHRWRQA